MTRRRSFVEEKRQDWRRLDELLRAVESRGLRSTGEEELREAVRLYRKATSDLAQAQTFARDPEVLALLNGLVGRGHGLLYRTPPLRVRSAVEFLWRGFPERVRRHRKGVAAAAAILFGTMAFGFLLVTVDFEARDFLLPDGFRAIEKSLAEQDRWAAELTPEVAPAASAWILTNNIRVALLAFAGGIFFGFGAVVVLAYNGLMIGAVMGTIHHYGKLTMLVAFMVPHGVIELTCICIAGAAGMALGSGLISPGERSVRDALVERGRDAALLALGTAPLLVVAGAIEGFISPLPIPPMAAGLFALLPASALAWYLLRNTGDGLWSGRLTR